MGLRDGAILGVSVAFVLVLAGCSCVTESAEHACWLVDPRDYNDKVDQLREAQTTLERANQQVYRLRREKQEVCAALAEAEDKIKELEYALVAREKLLAEAQKEIAGLQEARSDREAVKAELVQAMKELDRARTDIETARVEASREGKRAGRLEEQVTDLKSQVEGLKVRLAEAARRLAELLEANRGDPGAGSGR